MPMAPCWRPWLEPYRRRVVPSPSVFRRGQPTLSEALQPFRLGLLAVHLLSSTPRPAYRSRLPAPAGTSSPPTAQPKREAPSYTPCRWSSQQARRRSRREGTSRPGTGRDVPLSLPHTAFDKPETALRAGSGAPFRHPFVAGRPGGPEVQTRPRGAFSGLLALFATLNASKGDNRIPDDIAT